MSELAEAGVARISVGGSFAFAAYAALDRMATTLLGGGTYDWLPDTRAGRDVTEREFG